VSTSAAHPRGIDRLCVFFACDAFVCAIHVRSVVRLATLEEAQVIGAAPGAPLDGTCVVDAGDAPFAAWDLSRLLEIPQFAGAFVLLRIPWRGAEVPIALRTGPCLVVRDLPGVAPVPASLFRARRGAIVGAFDASALGAPSAGRVAGLEIDPARLLDAADLETSLRTLRSAPVDGGRAP
jgi:hypothetical protein